MATCGSCRRGVPDVALFCPRCGQRVGSGAEIASDPAADSLPPFVCIEYPPPLPPAPPPRPVMPLMPPMPRGPYDPMLIRKPALGLPVIIIIVIAAVMIMMMCFGVMIA